MYIPLDIQNKFIALGAVKAGQITIEKKNWYSGNIDRIPFKEHTHFFDKNNVEIGYFSSISRDFPAQCPNDCYMFPDGRTWAPELLSQMVWRELDNTICIGDF